MFAPSKIKVGARAVALALALAASSFSAQAVLQRAGPVSVDPAVGGFPAWYQDTTGITIEFCGPKNASEVAGAWCLLLPANIAVTPEVFPGNFFIEHFYFGAGATIGTRQAGGKAILSMGMEASFANGSTVRPGDQTTFSRIRYTLNPVPATGTYRFYSPYGFDDVPAAAGDKIHYTNDVGLGCGLDFTCALHGRMGPFLLASDTPGGAEMPALTAANPAPDTNPANFGGAVPPVTAYPGTGNSYIADPARLGPVTGSSLPDFTDSTGALRNHNIFRIEGPVGSALGVNAAGNPVDWVETTNFSLNGRLYTGTLPGVVTIDRASYTRSAGAQKVDVFATAAPTTQARLPAAPVQLSVSDSMAFYAAPCAGVLDPLTGAIVPPFSAPVGFLPIPMKSDGALQWGQEQPVAPATIPAAVCVLDASTTNAAGVIVPSFFPQIVTDEVTVTPAFYDPTAQTLTVGATSSDTVLAPTLTLAYSTFLGDLTAGQIVVPALVAPPSDVLVESSALGITKYMVSTGFKAGVGGAGLPVAVNDVFPAFLMNSGPQVFAVLANDINVAGGTVTLTSPPHLGTAVVNADGTVTFTPNVNAAGTDAFNYKVTVGANVSNIATSSITITSVNLPPVAVSDAFNAIAGHVRTFNVLANDTDPNGAADIVAAVNVSASTPAGATITVAGGNVSITAPAGGAPSYTFTYQAQDAAGAVSALPATATVTVAASEQITQPFAKSQYTQASQRLIVSSTVTPAADQTVTVELVDGRNNANIIVYPAGTATVNATGVFTLDLPGFVLPNGVAITTITAVRVTPPNSPAVNVLLQLK